MKKIAIAAVFTLVTLTAAACGQKTAEAVETTAGTAQTTMAATTEAAAETTTEANGGNISETASEPEDFANYLKLVVKSKDFDGLIGMSAFPIYISSIQTNDGVVESIEEFGEIDPGSVFTEDFMDAIISYDVTKLLETEAGYVLGEGTPNITFKKQDDTFKITGLNIK